VSSFLYALGRTAYRRRHVVLAIWLSALVMLGGLASTVRGEFDEKFSVPGTESQAALDSLGRTFPQAGGVTAQLVVVAPDGGSVRDTAVRKAIEAGVDRLNAAEGVEAATSPFDKYAKGVIADDGSAAIISLRLEVVNGDISAGTYRALEKQTDQLQASIPGSEASIGGEAYNNNRPGFSIVEALGVVVALIVLLLTLGSLRAAGMPLLTALLGVAITMLLIIGATGITTVSSTTPLLAVMLGLAVGIDYALFIVSRHREQLAGGMEAEESAAQALATAGSAVVFAGLTVMIALVGLAVAGIPFLTTMGVAASVGVLIAVLIALTLLPSLLGFAGSRLRPKVRASRARRPTSTERRSSGKLARGWVRFITKIPVVTIVLVIAALLTLAYPAKDLRIALPSNGVADPGTPARVTYDLISDHFGPGYNGPLIVSATIVGSDDPLGVMDGIADEIRQLPGVASVPLATPNQNADTGIIQVIPENGPDTQQTKDLVRDIRSRKAHFEDAYDVPVYVTGYTAVAIDVSDRLGRALLPFGVLVVGLSLILLTMVFRSIAVPIKATLGYLLSVGAAFGVTAMVFEWGWFGSVFNVAQTAPVISFLPILLMGILFGLAMDYEVFLVSRIREAYVHGRSAGLAIEQGFVSSSRVVVAAAIIMFSVFAAFVPQGEGPIKTIAFGLAVGVFVDAFVVRMTLVPAILALLGRSAWWLPAWIDRRLPSFDVEGAALTHQLSLASWPSANDQHVIVAEGLQVTTGAPIELAAMPRDVVVVEGPAGSGKTALLLSLSGRMRIGAAKVKVAGLVLPEQAAAVRRRTGYLDCGRPADVRRELAEIVTAKPAVIFVDHADQLTAHDQRAALASLLDDVVVGSRDPAVVLAVRDRSAVADLIPGRFTTLTMRGVPDLAGTPR
jgi:putative drug exporter of the RND superfamily